MGGTYNTFLNRVYLYKLNQSFKTFLPKPYRRDSRFKSLKHDSNSSIGNKWVHQETRINQLKYYNEVRQHQVNFRIDGLNTLMYDLKKEKDKSKTVKQISVEL